VKTGGQFRGCFAERRRASTRPDAAAWPSTPRGHATRRDRVPKRAAMKRLSRRGGRRDSQALRRAFSSSKIVYVIKENRTYDQVFGDNGRVTAIRSSAPSAKGHAETTQLADSLSSRQIFNLARLVLLSARRHQAMEGPRPDGIEKEKFGGWPQNVIPIRR